MPGLCVDTLVNKQSGYPCFLLAGGFLSWIFHLHEANKTSRNMVGNGPRGLYFHLGSCQNVSTTL
jgi:hypothetical protein